MQTFWSNALDSLLTDKNKNKYSKRYAKSSKVKKLSVAKIWPSPFDPENYGVTDWLRIGFASSIDNLQPYGKYSILDSFIFSLKIKEDLWIGLDNVENSFNDKTAVIININLLVEYLIEFLFESKCNTTPFRKK